MASAAIADHENKIAAEVDSIVLLNILPPLRNTIRKHYTSIE
jgi:hypothetical protein